MAHPIKFKAWHKELEKWVPTSDICIYSTTEVMMPTGSHAGDWYEASHQVEIYFYTGLKDKNEKRIFEGSIVEMPDFTDRRKKVTGVVKFVDGGYIVDHGDGIETQYSFLLGPEETKVIGHICENPELLED